MIHFIRRICNGRNQTKLFGVSKGFRKFYLQFEEPFNGQVSIDLFFNGNIYSEIPSNYFIEIYFNDGSNDSKTFKKQKDLIQYIKEIMKGNI